MYFFYKIKKSYFSKDIEFLRVELYDFILGKLEVFAFDDENFVNVEQQIKHKLKDVKMSYQLRELK